MWPLTDIKEYHKNVNALLNYWNIHLKSQEAQVNIFGKKGFYWQKHLGIISSQWDQQWALTKKVALSLKRNMRLPRKSIFFNQKHLRS